MIYDIRYYKVVQWNLNLKTYQIIYLILQKICYLKPITLNINNRLVWFVTIANGDMCYDFTATLNTNVEADIIRLTDK